MTFNASQRTYPNYNIMAVAKAALEAEVRYLAYELGPRNIRVNAISAGPVRTLAARSITGFTVMEDHTEKNAPLRRNIAAEDVGNAALLPVQPAGQQRDRPDPDGRRGLQHPRHEHCPSRNRAERVAVGG